MNSQRLKILFLPSWYPSEKNPVSGIFIKEHAKAASLYNDIVVLYAYPDPSPSFKGLYRISEEEEERIRTIRARYGGILAYTARRLLASFSKPDKINDSKGNLRGNPILDMLKKLLRIPFLIINDLFYYWSIFACFRRLVREGWKPDVIHAHILTAGVPAVLLGKLYRIPVIITEHWSAFPLHNLTPFGRMEARFAMNRAEIVLPDSDNLRKSIESYGIKNRFKIVPNVVNNEIFHPPPSQNGLIRNGSKRILLVALLTPVKGISYLLEALSQLKEERQDFVLDIVGDGPNRIEYEELARKLQLNEIVRFHGLKPKEEVAEFMRECDFFVLPSFYENFGVVYIEAMACGKPVIATNAGGPKEIVNEDIGVLVPPKDVEALIKAIEYMLDNYQNYSTEKIAQYAKKRFSYEAIGKILDEVYKSIHQKEKIHELERI